MNYPHIPLATPIKLYYLTQLASWFHQVLILNAEARRKDHYQMLSHHIITIALLLTSYYTNFTRVGCLIMVLMDWCDAWFALAKMMRYLSLPTLCDVCFVVFLVSWIVTRQILFLLIIYSAYEDAPKFIKFEWAPERGHYLTRNAHFWFIALLVALQVRDHGTVDVH
jgi:very-long-chain ceramide synthase